MTFARVEIVWNAVTVRVWAGRVVDDSGGFTVQQVQT